MPVFKRKCKRCKKNCSHREVWYYAFCIRGSRYREAIPEARTKYHAEQAEAAARLAVFEGRYGSEPSNIKLREFVETQYLPWAHNEKKSWRNDQSRAKPILAYFGAKKMREITTFSVEQFKRDRRSSISARGSVRSPSSVNRELQLLSRIFSLAVQRGAIENNPCRNVKLCSVPATLMRYLTAEEEARLIPLLRERWPRLWRIVTIDLYTGMRMTEVLTLHKSQVDFKRGVIELLVTKSGKPRTIPIHNDIDPVLRMLCEEAGPTGYLFENLKTGKPVREVKTAWRSALPEAGIQGFRFHDLRHSFGTMAADGGAHPKDIQAILGHADINTTMRYVHATDEGKRKAVDAAAKARWTTKSASHLPHEEKAS